MGYLIHVVINNRWTILNHHCNNPPYTPDSNTQQNSSGTVDTNKNNHTSIGMPNSPN